MSDLSARLEGLSRKERAALLELARRKKAAAVVAVGSPWEAGGEAPASFSQERMWLLDQLTPGSPAYTIPGAIHLEGALDRGALPRVFAEIERRHAALRTVFAAQGGRPVQRVLPFRPRTFAEADLSALPEAAREAEARRLAAGEAGRPFDLERGPLFRTLTVVLGPREHLLLYSMHHIVSDGWSTGVFFREVGALYAAFAAGQPSPLPELTLQYADFASRQRQRLAGPVLEQGLAAWRRLLDGLEPLELPGDRPRPPVRSWRGASLPVAFSPAEVERLGSLGREERATLYMTLLALLQVLLHRLAGQDDVAVGTAVANRSDRDIEGLIGFFVNSLVMRTDLTGDPPLREVLRRARRAALDSFHLQEIPFEKVVEALQPERHPSRTPLFQVMLTLQNTPQPAEPPAGLVMSRREAPRTTAKFDLTLTFREVPAGLAGGVEFDLDLFEPATVARWMRHLRTLADAAVADPERRISTLPLLTPEEHAAIVHAGNGAAVEIPRDRPLHRLFEEQVDRAPDAVALCAEGEAWTYAQLDASANRLAHHLRRRGAGPEVPVAVCAERSPALVAALLAVMKSGGFFVPLDPALPRERLASMLALSGARLALAADRDLLPEGLDVLPLTADGPADRPAGEATAGNLVYAMFTSGSTGEPKGVAVTHGNVVRLVRGTDFGALGPEATFLMLAPAAFDASTLELWGPLANGGRVVVFPPHPPSLDELAAFLERHAVSRLWLTAGLFHQMAEERPDAFSSLARLLAGGDVVSPEAVRRVLAAHPHLVLVNGYGPTESTTFATCHALTAADPVEEPLPIGRPIANTTAHVLEPGLTPSPLGVWGELWLGGEGLARGYLGRPDLTAERFLPAAPGDPTDRSDRSDPSDAFQPGARLYRTGDRARRRPDGLLEIGGRLDRQVKIRGHRIEPAEVEAALAGHPGVVSAAVLVRGEGSDKRLVAYVAGGADGAELRRWLATRLPEPLVPAAVVGLERLPLTDNGKVDRRALARIAPERGEAAQGYVAPRTPAEEALAGLWEEILGAERTGGRVGARDHFFELGGHSLLATRLAAAIRDAFGVEMPLQVLFERPVLEDVARELEILTAGRSPVDEAETAAEEGPVLSFAQERLWLLDQIAPGTAAYNVPGALRLLGDLDVAALGRVVGEIVRRHEALRTTFRVEAGRPVQRIEPWSPGLPAAGLPLIDLSGLPEPVQGATLDALAREEASRPFDLAAGPLFRAALLRLRREPPQEHATFYTMHHVVSDGWSMGVFLREVGLLYAAFATGRPSPLPELPLQYADFARRQRRRLAGPRLEQGLAAWRALLDGVAPLELPTDRPRPAVRSWRGAAQPVAFPPGSLERLAALARAEKATLYMALLALGQTFLHRLAGQDDVAVGTVVANRPNRDVEGLIGFFVNSLVVRTDLAGDPPFREALQRARRAALQAFHLQEIPFEKVVEAVQPERQAARTPLFQVMWTLQNTPRPPAPLSGLTLVPVEAPRTTAKFDLTGSFVETPAGLAGELEFDLDLLDPATVARWVGHFLTLTRAALAAPERRISELPLLTPEERAAIIHAGNGAAVEIPRDRPLHRLFEEQVDRAPDAVALCAEGEAWTYAQLDATANRLAHHLRRRGAGPEVPVAVCAERSPALVAALLAVMKSGGFFVPLDPALPRERLASMLALSGARLALAADRDLLPEGLDIVPLTADGPADRPAGGATAGNLLYAMFTSGSTGEPKGVAVTHGNVVRLVRGTDFGALGPDATFLMLAPAAFDASTLELWGPLANGGRVVVFPPHPPSLDELAAFLARHAVSRLWLTAGLFHQMAEERPDAFQSLARLLAGGDVVSPEAVRRVLAANPHLVLVNGYGPTESTTFATCHGLTAADPVGDPLPIGRPIANTTAHVLEPGLTPSPLGVWGELWLGGEGLARGYLGRPDLTAERFLPAAPGDPADRSDRSDPSDVLPPGARLYRTGDRARRRPDGLLEIRGRLDRQVKIRGHRIEPAEVEAVLAGHPGVTAAAVLVRGEGADKRLVAYVAGSAEGEELRRWLAARLPETLVPAAVVGLERLPLTPNGKVDRGALARIAPERAPDGYVAPRTPTEEVLAGLWLEILGPERTGGRVGARDHFFDLGGHSLLGTRLIAALREVFGVELPLHSLFERPVLEEIAREVEALGGGRAVAAEAPGVEETGPAPLSFAQERLWLLDQIAPGTAAYNMPGAFRLRGALDGPALDRAVGEIVRRHEALRTTFRVEAGQPVQRVEARPFSLPWIDLSALPEPVRSATVDRLAREEAVRPFDLATGPLFRAALLRLAREEHAVLYTMHHIVSDGWSMGVFFEEVAALYAAFAAGRPSPLPALPLQYAGFARRQRRRLAGPRLDEGLAAWRRILDGVAPLELPADRPRPAVRTWRGASRPVSWPAGTAAGLALLARRERGTLYMVLLALVQTLLHRLAGQDDVAVGTAVANRTEREVEGLIGFFVNSLVMRTDLAGDPPLAEALRRVRKTALEAFQLQEIPFEKVVEAVQPERHVSRAPLFQVMLTLQNTPRPPAPLAGLDLERVDAPQETAKFDLTLAFLEAPDGLSGGIELDLDLFDPATVDRWLGHLRTLADAAVADPARRLSELPLLTPEEQEAIVHAGNGAAVEIPRDRPLHRLFEEQVDRAPDAVALCAEGEAWTYAQLDATANRLAHHLRRRGAGPEVPVAVCAERSPALVAALLAVMKSGGFFVPLDPALPRERLASILALSGARLALAADRDLLPEGLDIVPLTADGPADRPAGGATAGNLVYAMFTSGSTGEPKGVAVTHGNVVRLVRGTDFGALGPEATFLMLAPAAFDASTLELWGPLANGGRVVVFPPHPPSLDELADFLVRHAVSRLWLTAGLFHQMAEERPDAFQSLARLLAGGDVVSPEAVRRVLAATPHLVLVNGYGPTESTTFATCHTLTAVGPVDDPLPIGRPIANTTAHVLEPGLTPAPLGVWGELWLGGEGLARGYLGRPDLTAERFLPAAPVDPTDRSDRSDPSDAFPPGARLYRTGDRARRRPDGLLEIRGRLDRQVKIRGHRIEPAEVEAVLAGHPGVTAAAVLVRGDGADRRLVAYVAGGPDVADAAELRRWLAARLPEPLVPAAVVGLERLPLTPNGKVDRPALARIAPERTDEGYVAPRTPVEETVAGLYAEILGAERAGDRVGAQDDFFALGGHSLLATQVASRVRAVFAVDLPVRTVFEAPVVADLAACIERLRGGARVAEAPLVPVPRTGAEPLSFAQQRLWFLDRLQPGSPAYNVPSFVRLLGRLAPDLLERVLGALVRRHESLRTTFGEQAGTPFQRIHPSAPVPLPRVDLEGLPVAHRTAEARRLAAAETLRGFALERGPLLRATLLRLGAEEHVLLSTMHHIVSDGWSTGVLAREVSLLYDAFRQGSAAPLPELPVQYADFAVWQRNRLAGEALEGELAFWRSRLADLPAVLDLPTDRPRPAVQGHRGALLPLAFSPALAAALASLGCREGTTPFMTLLAAFQALLGRAAGQERFAVGTPIAGRNRVEIEPLIGFFVNTLVLRADLAGAPTFRALLHRVREAALDAHAHQELPFERLVEDLEVERSLRHTPLFQTLFAFQNTPAARLTLPGLTLLPVEPEGIVAKFDLSLNLAGLAGDADGLGGSFDYSTDLFDATTVQRFARQLELLLEALAADPGQGVLDVPLLGEAEAHQVRVEWNDTRVPEAPPVPVRVAEQAARRPEHPAVEGEAESLTYAELLHRARCLAEHFRPGALAPLIAERSPELIVQMLAVWWAGGAFLPVDPAWPRERREQILLAKDDKVFKDNKDPGGVSSSLLTLATLPSLVLPQSPAYLLYTSGSTGRPKGVLVPHAALASFVEAAVAIYGLTPEDRVLQFASLSFDTSAEEIWPTLAAGATLVLRPEEMASSIPRFLREVERLRLTVLDLPTAFWHELVVGMEAGDLALPGAVRLVILGGEEALADRLALWLRRVGSGVRLVNTYGPTETTIVATRRELSPLAPGSAAPIGRPLPGVRAHVLDRSLHPVPPGGRGELWIGGAGVAQGYLGQPALTAERFLPDPAAFGARLYRTGDLAILRPDGDLVFAGRADRQVKIRGYRIEPGEIEDVLRRHPAVREAVVVVREEAAGDRSLVAFVVAEAEAGWREWAGARLPGFMVPAAFVTLDALPLTATGKVDRRALAKIAPQRAAEEAYAAPRTPVEETLAGLLVEILGTARTGGRVGLHDSFFALGGHSLLATRVIAAVRDAFQVDLPLRLLFERPTVEGLAQAIVETRGGEGDVEAPIPALPRGPGVHRFPVSFSQLREWILDRLEPGNPAYNIPSPLRIEGPLAVPVLRAALREIVRRHEVFRTAFVAGEEEPVQEVLPEVHLAVPVVDLSVLPAAERERALLQTARLEAGLGFDLAAAPLLRAWIVLLAPEDHALLLTVHHIVSDGWSTSILHQELAALVAGSALPPLPLHYGDYAAWQRRRGELLERQAVSWSERLAGAPLLLELPTDRPRPPVRGNCGGKVPFHLPPPVSAGLVQLARRRGATPFMVLLAGYQALLGRWSGQDDVVVGTYGGHRPRRELEGLIGFFINTLVLRTGLTDDPSFETVLDRVRATTLGAYAHAEVPFEKLLEILALPRDPSRTPLFQALLVLQNTPELAADLRPGVRLTALPVASETADFDLALWLAEGADGIAGVLKFSAELFDAATLHRFAEQLRTLLEAAVAAPERNVWELPLITAEAQREQLTAWSRGPAVPAGAGLLHRLVEEQAARTPHAVALEAGAVHLTYAGLLDRAAGRARGIEPGTIVALPAERSPELIVDLLAVLQAGAAYLPVDPGAPRERREMMVRDSGAVWVAKDDKVAKDDNDPTLPGSPVSLLPLATLSSFSASAAYVIYTSGSTGLPKGVVVPHRAIASFVRGAVASYELGPVDRVLQLASLSFDTSAEEIWPALASGATLVLRPEDMAASIPHFLRELARLGITVLDLPTAFWHELVAGLEAEDLALPPAVRLVLLGGEEALPDRFALWQKRVGTAVRLVNTYGPTEATIVATRHELTGLAPGELLPIGRPIAGARAYVLDRFLAPVPPGVRGELWLGGAGIAQGYLGRPDLTAERFRPDPFGDPGARLYRSGDLAVLTPAGDLLFAGRADRQLKLRGYRIEPGEVEAALRRHPAVRDAVVEARRERLVAWVVPAEGAEVPGALELRAFLRDRLPEPLVPAAFATLAALPLGSTGKVDRRALPEPDAGRPAGGGGGEPQSALERTIAEIYRDLLRVGHLGLDDNFFDLGGHSLLIVRAHQKLKAALGREIPVLDLFRFPTVATLARHLGGAESGSLRKVQSLAGQQRAAQQRQKEAMERLRRPGTGRRDR